jgi:hypothetical protein
MLSPSGVQVSTRKIKVSPECAHLCPLLPHFSSRFVGASDDVAEIIRGLDFPGGMERRHESVVGTTPTKPHAALCAKLARADISPKSADFRFDPNVWSGRALQENFHRVGGCAVLHQCIRPLIGASCAPGHHGYQRACDLITGKASRGHLGHQCSHAPGFSA